MQLYEALSMHLTAWREDNYKHDEFPAIAEILEWAKKSETTGFHLRAPQLRALETYWYLRLVEETPHIFDLYQSATICKTCAVGTGIAHFLSRIELLHSCVKPDDRVRTCNKIPEAPADATFLTPIRPGRVCSSP